LCEASAVSLVSTPITQQVCSTVQLYLLTMSFCPTATSRKAKRKEAREAKKQKKRGRHNQHSLAAEGDEKTEEQKHESNNTNNNNNTDGVPSGTGKRKGVPVEASTTAGNQQQEQRSVGKKARRSTDAPRPPTGGPPRDVYASLPPEVAAAMRRDDDEIADLEVKLGISGGATWTTNNGTGRNRLNNEYAKKECFGEDFGDFLNGLDTLVHRILKPNESSGDEASLDDADEEERTNNTGNTSESEQHVEEHVSTE